MTAAHRPRILFVLNDPPYGTERSYNGLRLAGALAKRGTDDLRVFLMGDAAACAKSGQAVPQGYYNLNRMLAVLSQKEIPIEVCGSCMDARGITPAELVPGATKGTLEGLADSTQWADKVLVF
jgi:uncharacterized protein involved in oxidation of intracellular sulfur